MYYNDFSDFLKMYVLHGSVTTHIKCSEIFSNRETVYIHIFYAIQ